mmetsp:Transcript_2201/g.4712  ORF Transcript_2201/g.4712 Transcript_2201/m.4712 type:complete len:252 (+) Transcript_2201:1057-1812(+)
MLRGHNLRALEGSRLSRQTNRARANLSPPWSPPALPPWLTVPRQRPSLKSMPAGSCAISGTPPRRISAASADLPCKSARPTRHGSAPRYSPDTPDLGASAAAIDGSAPLVSRSSGEPCAGSPTLWRPKKFTKLPAVSLGVFGSHRIAPTAASITSLETGGSMFRNVAVNRFPMCDCPTDMGPSTLQASSEKLPPPLSLRPSPPLDGGARAIRIEPGRPPPISICTQRRSARRRAVGSATLSSGPSLTCTNW